MNDTADEIKSFVHNRERYFHQQTRLSDYEKPLSLETLQNICFQRVSLSLREQKYAVVDGSKANPFTNVPSLFVNELFSRVAEAHDVSLETLCPLVCSGQMTEMRLTTGSRISTDDFLSVCGLLEPHAFSLAEVSVDTFYPRGLGQKECAKAVERLLGATRHLRLLRMSVPFNLSVLRQLEQLQFLEVNVIVSKATLKVKRTVFHKNNDLKHVYVDRCSQQTLKKKEVAAILKSCSQLLVLKNDVAEALEHIHGSSSFLPRYKLQQIVLGKASPSGASLHQVQLAVLTCPDVVNLTLFVSDKLALMKVAEMSNLHTLNVKWLSSSKILGDFEEVFVPFLESVGHRLRSLVVSGFANITFDSFLTFAANLVELKVTGFWGDERAAFTRCKSSNNRLIFDRLETLSISFPVQSKEDAVALYQIIFIRAPRLERLRVFTRNSFDLDDSLLALSLSRPLQHLSHIIMHKCCMSASSIVTFVQHCPSLEVFHFSACPNLTAADVQCIRSSILPANDIKNFSFFKWKIVRVDVR